MKHIMTLTMINSNVTMININVFYGRGSSKMILFYQSCLFDTSLCLIFYHLLTRT